MKYKVGDVVKFRDDLIIETEYGGLLLWPEMAKKIHGGTATIKRYDYDTNHFLVEESPYIYSIEMLEEQHHCDPVSLDISELL